VATIEEGVPFGRVGAMATVVRWRGWTGSHDILADPTVLSPAEGAVTDHDDTVISWEPVTKPAGIDIANVADASTLRGHGLAPTRRSASVWLSVSRRWAVVLASERSWRSARVISLLVVRILACERGADRRDLAVAWLERGVNERVADG